MFSLHTQQARQEKPTRRPLNIAVPDKPAVGLYRSYLCVCVCVCHAAMPAKVTATENLPVKLLPAAPQVYEQLARDHEQQGENAPPVHVFPEGGLTNGNGGWATALLYFVGRMPDCSNVLHVSPAASYACS